MTTLEVLSHLTDSTFMSVVALVFGAFIALEVIHQIGGRK